MVVSLRAFHIATKVNAATSTLSGRASPIAANTRVKPIVVVKAQHVAELHQEQQHRRHVLEAGHHRMRREFDQRAEPQQPEQRLEQAAEQDDGEEHQQRRGHVRRRDRHGSRCTSEYSRRPRKNVVVMRGA